MSRDLYQEITDKIVAQLEQGIAPWVQPWRNTYGSVSDPHNAVSRRCYSGINVLLLWIASIERGYHTSGWLTFKQAKDLGANVKKGEKATQIVFVKQLTVADKDAEGKPTLNDSGEENVKNINMLRAYHVFNVSQCENLPARYTPTVETPTARPDLIDPAFRDFIAATQADITHGGNRACYSPSRDAVTMPHPEAFTDASAYKATLLHELTHWTGHKSRLDRNLRGRFGNDEYAAEELIAELGAAYLCAGFQIDGQLQHADYIGHWLSVLKQDKRAIFTAASAAQKAADYLKSMASVTLAEAA